MDIKLSSLSKNLEGINKHSLNIIETEGGKVLHALRHFDEGFKGFGEAYFSTIEPNNIKAWKKHTKMTLNLIVPEGSVGVVLFDARKKSKTYKRFQVVYLSTENYQRLTVPPKVWFGFKCLSKKKSLLLNIADINHDPKEVDSKKLGEISFPWEDLII